jgi:hypothetical protein
MQRCWQLFGLAAIGYSMVLAKDRSESRQDIGPAVQDRVILNSAEISHIKTVLRLTREQEQYWPPV